MSDQPQRAFSTAFKESAVLRLRAGECVAAVANELLGHDAQRIIYCIVND